MNLDQGLGKKLNVFCQQKKGEEERKEGGREKREEGTKGGRRGRKKEGKKERQKKECKFVFRLKKTITTYPHPHPVVDYPNLLRFD